MKRFFTFFLLLLTLSLVGCVDDNFNLGDIDNENNGLGDADTEVTAPIGTIEIDLDEIMTISRAAETYTLISQTVEDELELKEGWMSDDIKDILTSNGSEIKISVECTPFPDGLPEIKADLAVGDVQLFDATQVINAETPKITTTSLDQSEIDAIAAAKSLNYKLLFSEKSFTCDFEDCRTLTVKISITRTGAITIK